MSAREAGQAAVELAVLAPVLALAVLVFAQLALAFRAQLAAERAAGRAQAAAVLGRPVPAAARAQALRRARARACAAAGSRSTCRAGCAFRCRSSRACSFAWPLAPGAGVSPRGERGAVAVGAVALLLSSPSSRVRASIAGAGLLLDERQHGSADAVALAAAGVLERRYGEAVDGGGIPARGARDRAARRAPPPSASRSGWAQCSSRSSSSAARATRRRWQCGCASGCSSLSDAAARARRHRLRPAGRRRGLPPRRRARPGCAPAPSSRPRSHSSAGRTSGAGRAAPRAGSTARASSTTRFAAAGLPVGRLDAAGLQRLARRVPAGAGLLPGDLVFVGEPAHHVGLVVAPGTRGRGAAPRRAGARRAARRGRLDGRGPDRAGARGSARSRGRDLAVPAYVPAGLRALVARSARAEQVPPALLAAQLEAESGFDAAGGLGGRRAGHRAVHAGDLGRLLEPAARAQSVRAGGPRSPHRRG